MVLKLSSLAQLVNEISGTLPWILLGLVVASILCVLVHRAVFHPLAAYPGPWLAKFTSSYGAYHSAKGDLHLDVKRCHEIYGPIVRYGPNRLIFNSIRALHDIYGFGNTVGKSTSYLTMVPWKDGWTVITSLDKRLHKGMRQTLQSGLSPAGLQAFEEVSLQNIDTLIDIITHGGDDPSDPAGCWSSPKEMTILAKWLAIDSMGSLAFGRNVGLLTDPSLRYIVDVFDLYTWRTGFWEQWPRLWQLGIEEVLNLGRHISPLSKKFCAWRDRYTVSAIDANNRTRMGVFSGLASSSDGDGGGKQLYRYTRSQMEAEGSFILLVAGDSNATAIAAALFYLSRYPHALDALTSELRDVFPSKSEIRSGPELNSCSYLRAVISEVLRIHPPSPGVPWREARAGTVIDGTPVPAGVDVGCSLYVLQHDAEVFREPERFWPERWLPGTLPEEELRRASLACKPFSLGPRSCAGKAVAMNEISLVLSRIAFECEFRIARGELGTVGEGREGNPWGRTDKDVFQFETHFTAMTKGPWLEFRRR